MDLATLIGLLTALGIVLASIMMGGDFMTFVNVPSLLVVVGGTIGAVMMKFTLGQFLGAFKVALKAFLSKLDKPEELIAQSVEMANEARKGGLLALEGKETPNEFMAKGIQLMVDGHEPEVIRQTLITDMNTAISRHEIGNRRELVDAMNERFHARGGNRYLYLLFPGGPVAQGCEIAGLRVPSGSVDKSFGSVV